MIFCLLKLGSEQCNKLPERHVSSHLDLHLLPLAVAAVFRGVIFHFQQECGCRILDFMDGWIASDSLPKVSAEVTLDASSDLLIRESSCRLLMWRCFRRLQTFFLSSIMWSINVVWGAGDGDNFITLSQLVNSKTVSIFFQDVQWAALIKLSL